MTTKTMSYDEWWDTYKPIAKGKDDYRYETFGDELRMVMNTAPNNVWTEVEADGEGLIVNGFALVNRLTYFITEVPWSSNDMIEVHDPDQTLLDMESHEEWAEEDSEPYEMCGVCAEMLEKRKETA